MKAGELVDSFLSKSSAPFAIPSVSAPHASQMASLILAAGMACAGTSQAMVMN
jgi:hypothetical protein